MTGALTCKTRPDAQAEPRVDADDGRACRRRIESKTRFSKNPAAASAA
jgi:hypothetical protein